MEPTTLEIIGTVLFGLAILHTFSVKRFEMLAHRYPEGSIGENIFHIFSEVEVVFGLWAAVLIATMIGMNGADYAIAYLESGVEGYSVHFTEPVFVFAIMSIAATRPILQVASDMIGACARLLPLQNSVSFFAVALVLGPLLGSFITEPAAMTVTALVLKARYYDRGMSSRLMYATLGVLFVNVSIGGTLTHFAAPPVLMVAGKWNWDIAFMTMNFGWKSALAVVINVVALVAVFRTELREAGVRDTYVDGRPDVVPRSPWWLIFIHVLFLAGVVATNHHMVFFLGLFLFFLGVVEVTQEYQAELQLKEALLVGFFLGGLVTIGAMQRWWLQPLLGSISDLPLFLGATGLTAITDNAALTFLGSQVDGLGDSAKYALVAGAVAGGGLTVIANAPNPAGYGILKHSFPDNAISPAGLLAAALPPTIVAMICLWFLP